MAIPGFYAEESLGIFQRNVYIAAISMNNMHGNYIMPYGDDCNYACLDQCLEDYEGRGDTDPGEGAAFCNWACNCTVSPN